MRIVVGNVCGCLYVEAVSWSRRFKDIRFSGDIAVVHVASWRDKSRNAVLVTQKELGNFTYKILHNVYLNL
jgi:hypothetical protein